MTNPVQDVAAALLQARRDNRPADAAPLEGRLQAAEDAYRQREVRYPIEVALNTFATPGPNGQPVQLSADIAPWLAQRLDDPSLETSLFDGASVNLSPAFESSKRFAERAEAFLSKALREAKQHSNWTEPNEAYETATQKFAQQLLRPKSAFWKSFSL